MSNNRLKDWKGEPIDSPECQHCGSYRVVTVLTALNDTPWISLGLCSTYCPGEVGLTIKHDSEDMVFDLCIECGTLQGEWPKPKTQLEWLTESPPF
jgi:Pyruvate/2-oxoacid:ferredoxin oxidoreductase delta subunit